MEVKGNFANYEISASGHHFPDDEEATVQALDHMTRLCGNPGQEKMIGDHVDAFFEWAIQALEDAQAYGTEWEQFAGMVIEEWYNGRVDMWQGTEDIWAEGWIMVAEQSGYHDSSDEVGEGTGQSFG